MNKLQAILSLLRSAFGGNPADGVVPVATDSRQLERRLVARFARGNTNLQLGRYTTAEDLERIKASFRGYRFSPSK